DWSSDVCSSDLAGARTGKLTVTDSASGSPHTVALAGTGVAPSAGVPGLTPGILAAAGARPQIEEMAAHAPMDRGAGLEIQSGAWRQADMNFREAAAASRAPRTPAGPGRVGAASGAAT